MADIAIFRINYKSDFILTLQSDAGWLTPFCIKFWTGAPSKAYYAYYDGMSYTHCTPVEGDPTKLLVQFDDHHLPIGDLKFQIGYHFTVADFPTSVEDEVINQASVIIEVDNAPAQVMLDFNGETAPEIEFSLPAYANEAQRIANEQARIAAEELRISNEEARIAAEQERISQETARVSEFARLKTESEAAISDANAAATLANEKAQLAADNAALAQAAADLANAKAQLAADNAALAQAAATLANEKAVLAQQKAEYAQEQGDAAKTEAETAHALNEEVREDEEARDHAEQTRQQQEAARQTAESQRVTDFNTQMQQQQTAYADAEAARETAFNEAEHQRDAKVDAKVADITNLQAQIGYFVCDTNADTAAKTIVATGYALTTGGNIRIKMTNANTADAVTLNINSTGAKALYYDGAQASASNTWEDGEVLEVYYDGTQYQCVSGGSGKFATGERVKEVSIINNLTSGGTTNVLSAEQGKTLYSNSLFEQNNRGNINTAYVGALRSNTWVAGTSYMGHKAFINDTQYDKILIQANSNSKNYVAFLKTYTYPIVNGSEADFCDGTTVIEIPANNVSILNVPSDCAYIVVSNSNASTTWQLPQRVSYINAVGEEVQVLKDEVESIISGQEIKMSEQILQLTWNVGYKLISTDAISATSGWSYCDYVDVSSYKKLRLKGLFGRNYGLNMYDENHTVICFYAPSGETTRDVVVDIPQYCKYVRYCVKSNNPTVDSSVAAFVYQSFNSTALREEYTALYNELYSDTLVEKLPELIDLGSVIAGQYRNGVYGYHGVWRCTENMVDIHVYKYLLTSGFYGVNYGLEFYDVDGNRIGYYYGPSEVSHTEYKVTIPEGVYYCRYTTKGTTIGTLKGIQYVSTTHQDIQDDITRIEDMFVNAGYRYLAGNYNISTENEDNTAALQLLVDTVNQNGGGIIEMPIGTYNFKNSITWRSNVFLVGQGENLTTLAMVGTNTFSLFTGDNVSNIGMSDFSVIASSMDANKGGKALFMTHIEDAVFENLKLVDTQATSFGIDFLNNVKIVNIHVINGGRGRWTLIPTGVGCSGIGIGMGWANHKENFVISNCICDGCYNNGIFVEDQGRFSSGGGSVMDDGSGQVIANNICRNGRNCGFSVWGGKKVTFIGNISYDNASCGFEIGYYGEDILMTGNQSIGNSVGFKIGSISKASTHILFTDNHVRANTTAVSIATNSATNYITIKDNEFNGNTNGINISGDSTGLILRDNDINGSTNDDIVISGTHTDAVIKGNTYMGTVSDTATYDGVTRWVESLT